jgi:hypothetical protein
MTKDEEFAPWQEGTTAYPIVGPDLSVSMAPVTASGKIIASKTQINPKAGYRALFLNTKGNRMGLQSRRDNENGGVAAYAIRGRCSSPQPIPSFYSSLPFNW